MVFNSWVPFVIRGLNFAFLILVRMYPVMPLKQVPLRDFFFFGLIVVVDTADHVKCCGIL